MGKLADKVKETLKDAKDTVVGEDIETEKSTGVEASRGYEAKDPMSPEKITEHEPTAVKREMEEKITGPGETGTNPEEAAERARRSGMTKNRIVFR
jgi:hypothetical protein